MAYVTKAEVRLRVADGTTTASLPDDELDMLIEQASRYFDLECGVDPEHFEPVAAGYEAVELERTFYGDGTHYLRIDPYVEGSISAVDLPADYTLPYYVERNGYLVRTGETHVLPVAYRGVWWASGGWPEGVPVTISAVWGYSDTPADVKMAIIELVINLWRETDPATLNLLDLERQPLRERLPPRVHEVVKRYRVNRNPAFV